ncbi:lytic transglycosylase domain-containing protein [Rhodopseudomonas rhenobacensis]|nr:lytic transglycosylase domain-containing protein [Rhodopseudomonas rhenobacensis]
MPVDATISSAPSAAGSRAQIAGAIKQAAGSTGTNFGYLVTTAKMESNFDPTAAASTSSAKGLYQFIEQTWLGTVKEAGSQFGYGQYADAITKSASGGYSVSDPTAKAAILKLRDDPVASSAMAGVLTQSNSFKLTGEIGRRPSDAELYMAHFMGVGGAAKLINNAENNPNASGAALFPNAAAANQSIFYDRSGAARSVSQVYSELSSRYDQAANSQATLATLAAGGAMPLTLASAVAAPADSGAYLSSFPDLRSATPPAATSNAPTTTAQYQPGFRSLYQPGDRAEPVSSTVQELWGSRTSTTSTTSTDAASSALARTPAVRAPQPLDLFSDRSGAFSG